jgi:hypothetical protein
MLDQKCAQHYRNIPLSNNTVSPWIANISEDSAEQLTENFRKKRLSIHTDEATDCSGIGHLIAYVRYVEDTKLKQKCFSATL